MSDSHFQIHTDHGQPSECSCGKSWPCIDAKVWGSSNPYSKTIGDVKADPYRILLAYNIIHPAHQHAVKKLLRCGTSHKTLAQDIQETIDTLERWKEMIAEDEAR